MQPVVYPLGKTEVNCPPGKKKSVPFGKARSKRSYPLATSSVFKRSVQMLTRGQFHAANFRQALEAADQRIAGIAFTVLVIEQLMSMIRAQWQTRAAFAFTPALFSHQRSNDPDHVHVSVQMMGFVEAARVGLSAG